MTTEITQVNGDGEVKTEIVSVDIPTTDPIVVQDSPSTETTSEAWRSFQTQTNVLFENTAESLSAFFKNNKPLLINVGWVLLALLGLQLLLSVLDVVDNIPLISPLLKLVGFIYTGWFVWRYLLRASNRQELGQILARTKSELLGDRAENRQV